jgi:hypothetical protein
MTLTLPIMLVALTLGTVPMNEPPSERLSAAPSLHLAFSQPTAWRPPEPDNRVGRVAKTGRFTATVAPRRVPRNSFATKLGAGFVGGLLGLYVGATVGGAVDCGRDCYTNALVGASVGTVAGAVVGVLSVR